MLGVKHNIYMLSIKCAKCKAKLFKYLKIGTGRVLKCHLTRISHDKTILDGDLVKCSCGNTIGKKESSFIKMNQNTFNYTGTKLKNK